MQPNVQLIRISRKRLLVLLSPLLVATLAACGGLAEVEADRTQTSERFDYSLSVAVAADASQAEVEAYYSGEVVVWRPEAGFAVLGLHDNGELRTQGAKKNKGAFKAPEVLANAVDGNGRSSWSGGRSAWSGGRSAWSGGRSAWSGGKPTTFAENVGYWDQVDLPEGQALTPRLGADVKVAVIDTGIDLRHPAFAGNLAHPNEWKDFVDGDRYPQEVKGANYGHGTGVADIIVQVAPNATILPIRVLGPDGSGDTTDVVAAIDHAVRMGADIINLSLGTEGEEKALKELVKYARKQDVILVASAGNNAQENILFPARHNNEVLSIGSVNRYDEISPFSAYGKELSLMAPGEHIYTAAPDKSVAYWSGTSFAAPIVSGAAALALGERPTYPKLKVKDVVKAVEEKAYDVSKRGRNARHKKDLLDGRLDIDDFLQKAFKL